METFTQEEKGFQLWLRETLSGHESLQKNSKLADFANDLLQHTNEYHKKHGNHVLYCRGQTRTLLSLEQATKKSQEGHPTARFARWYEFVAIAPRPRFSGPLLAANSNDNDSDTPGNKRFETLTIKVQASRNRARFGMTDDTGYLFPCLQQNIPRAFFLVMDHKLQNCFILHGNKKFAGQGDDGLEEGSAQVNDIHAPPTKCFPGTQNLKPTHYIFTWKANGKNAGVYGYRDPKSDTTWLFVNSKGVCECAGSLDDIVQDHSKTTFSDQTNNDTNQLPRLIFKGFSEAWNDGLNQEMTRSIWDSGYLFLFEFCDNKHVVLEYGKDGRPVDHCAFIGLVKLPTMGSVDTTSSGLVFRINDTFAFHLWKGELTAPSYTCKPTVHVRAEDLDAAIQQLMKGRFLPKDHNLQHNQWFDPHIPSNSMRFLAGEGVVCYEMAETDAGETVIRQLFKAKTASYITHRQFRGFIQRGGNKKSGEDQYTIFPVLYKNIHSFFLKKFGNLTDKPYPDPKDFGQSHGDVIEAASLFYTNFAMWLQQMSINWRASVSDLVGMMNRDTVIPKVSTAGLEYVTLAQKLGLRIEDIVARSDKEMVAIRSGIGFRIAEFSSTYSLDSSLIFAAPKDMIQNIRACSFPWTSVPAGYKGTIKIGFHELFPGGKKPKFTKAQKKKIKKKQGTSDILRPFRKSFSPFLASNPGVQVIVGQRDADLENFVFEAPPADSASLGILISSPTQERFEKSLMALPSLQKAEENMNVLDFVAEERLEKSDAIRQAEETLQKAFRHAFELFKNPVDLLFGDIKGRLIPITQCHQSPARPGMLIIRGVSGVGKSTVAAACQSLWGAEKVTTVEADQFFGPACPYHVELLSDAHADAQNRARQALARNYVELVVASNTGVSAKEYAEYVRIALSEQAPVSILTLDTETPLSYLCNFHGVGLEKVEKMATELRKPENNPEGKTLDEILMIANKQASADRRFASKTALAWILLGTEGAMAVRDLYLRFLEHAKEEGVVVNDMKRPANPHVTLAFIRKNDNDSEAGNHAFVRLWDLHGMTEEVTLGEVRYAVRQSAGGSLVLHNVAIGVSISSKLYRLNASPHITLAFDAGHAVAFDSNKLWCLSGSWAENVEVRLWKAPTIPTVVVTGQIEVGCPRGDSVVHTMPDWINCDC